MPFMTKIQSIHKKAQLVVFVYIFEKDLVEFFEHIAVGATAVTIAKPTALTTKNVQ